NPITTSNVFRPITRASTLAMNSSYPCGSPPPSSKKSNVPSRLAMNPSTLIPTNTDIRIAILQPRRLAYVAPADQIGLFSRTNRQPAGCSPALDGSNLPKSARTHALMDVKSHWDKVYSANAPEAVSWYRAHLETSLALVERGAPDRASSIIDIGAGESTLVDDLLHRGYHNLTVLDVSQTAIDVTKERLGSAADQIHWLVGDILEISLPPNSYDLWHDRAVFHFLTDPKQRAAYVRQ